MSTEHSRQDSGPRLLAFRDLRELKGIRFTRQWIDRLVKLGRFPKPIRPGGGQHKAWLEREIDAHIEACAAAREHEAADLRSRVARAGARETATP
jgi:predicted DNA-binding transcriptional regulator AlpA